ncbi:outer membrane beta-barrel protein [Parvularcula lutaonensis]|uniref:Outer membrane beta-barrel protein n=1 Tax=Parvularcula lutaonensis TaxID=491923 RepID=A0ABV7MDV4_9PROT|nr:outer membrane beta-barrel protein [Parvularcula lutaonensis]GGY51278.1 hypothetical protein GCM10007148_20190 [Parvularcula lutaonensis]
MTKTTLLAAAAAAGLALSAAHAQDEAFKPSTYYSMGVGAFSLASDDVEYPNGATTTNEVSTRTSLFLAVGRRMSEQFSLEGEVGVYTAKWDGFSNGAISFYCPSGEDCIDQIIRTTALTMNAVYSAPADAQVRPYAGIGAGLMITSYNLEDVDNDTGFGFIGKAGADVKVG